MTSGTAAGAIPSFSSKHDETGELTVTHREYIRDIYGNPAVNNDYATDFEHQSLALNPGLETSFPWLSQVAMNFEEYEFTQLMYTYRSTIADVASNNGQVGTVIMATNYNAAEPSFQSKSMMMGYAHTSSQKTTQNMLHGVECSPGKLSGYKGKYVRSQGLDPGQDIKSYDHGNFQLGIANTPHSVSNGTIGELWVSYTVKLRKPKYFAKEGFGITRDIFRSVPFMTGTNWNAYTILRGPVLHASGVHNSLGAKVSFPTGGTGKITFPAHYAGNLEIRMSIHSSTGGFGIQDANQPNPNWTYTAIGNVKGINDIVGTVNATSGITGVGESKTLADKDNHEIIIHVRVDIASNSLENSLSLKLVNPGANAYTTNGWVCEITEYNSTFGTNSSEVPQYQDSNGNVISF